MNKPKSTRGRPIDPVEQQRRKGQLLDAATELLKTHSYRSMTIRQIASAAGMKSAMISYYFDGKEGLFLALLERLSERHSQLFQHLTDNPDPLRGFIHGMLAMVSQDQHFARLIHDEILNQQGTLRDRIMSLFPQRVARLLPTVIQQLQTAGKMDPGLDPKWLAFSLISMIIMPFVAEPVRKEAWQIDDATLASEAWAEHIYRLFTQGSGVSHP